MRFSTLCLAFSVFAFTVLPAFAGVYVTLPASATVSSPTTTSATSPVHFVATATSPACSKGVGSMGIYTAPNVLAYSVKGASLDTNLSLSAGTYNVAVAEWDNCGWSSKALVTVTVASPNPSTSTSSSTP